MTETTPEKNEYALLNFKREYRHEGDTEGTTEGTQEFQKVVFYKLNPDGTFENGTTLEEILRVSIERLDDLNGRFACEENETALFHLKEALKWLNARTANREARGVEGKHEA